MFNQDIKGFFQSKTNWTAISMIVVAIVGYIAGEYTLSSALMQAMTGTGMLFLRDAIAKV